ncbi:MAG: hypothetical protein RJA81_1396 [Planctomycetota bacterium]|jgi:hypothetical protein
MINIFTPWTAGLVQFSLVAGRSFVPMLKENRKGGLTFFCGGCQKGPGR